LSRPLVTSVKRPLVRSSSLFFFGVLVVVWFSLAGTGRGGLCPVFSAVMVLLYL
jgi:hypothetical protein